MEVFFALVCTTIIVCEEFFVRRLCVLAVFDVYMMSEVVWKFFLLLFALLFPKSFVFGVCVFWLLKTCAQCTPSSLGAYVR